jgi:hypothetical protein
MRTKIRNLLAPVAIYAAFSLGCGTSYSPREPGRINFVLNVAGDEVLEKNGKTYRFGGFSGDLVEAVSGNPAAEEHARRHVELQRRASGLAIATGVVLGVALVCFVGGAAEPAGGTKPETSAPRYGTTLLLVSGLATLVAAGTLTASVSSALSSEGHLYDAVNIYNDAVGRQSPR